MSISQNQKALFDLAQEVRQIGSNQHPAELFSFLLYLRALSPKTLVEVGVERGGTALAIRKTLPDAHLILVDLNRPALLDQILALPGKTTFIQGPSQEVAAEVRKLYTPEDTLAFIDADHHYNAVCGDTLSYPAAHQAYHDIKWVPGNLAPRDASSERFYNEHRHCCFSQAFCAGWAGIGVRVPQRCKTPIPYAQVLAHS